MQVHVVGIIQKVLRYHWKDIMLVGLLEIVVTFLDCSISVFRFSKILIYVSEYRDQNLWSRIAHEKL